jgi:protein-disulfide isomerase
MSQTKLFSTLLFLALVPATAAASPTAREKVTLSDTPFRGAERAPVTIVEVVDYQCGYCKKADQTMRRLLEKHPNEVRLQLVHNPLPFHGEAGEAAAAVIAAGLQGKQWEMHDRLMGSASVDRATIEAHARALKLDLKKLARDQANAGEAVRRDMERAKAWNVKGTPAFFINGRHVVGARPLETFEQIVAEELAVAEKVAATGVPRERLYQEIVELGGPGKRADQAGECEAE